MSSREITKRLKADYHTVASVLSNGVRKGLFAKLTGGPLFKVRGKSIAYYSND